MKIPQPVLICSVIGTVAGGAVLIKDYIGGDPYETVTDASDKIVLVTGANCGIGKATAESLAEKNAKVIMACRDKEKCEVAREDIVLKTKNRYVYCRTCDLSSQESIRKFVNRFKKENNKLDILINNAAVMECPKQYTADGIELQLGVNHMGHFLLTSLLLDRLKQSPSSRIIILSDLAYEKGQINVTDLNSDQSYDCRKAYTQSKLANILFLNQLDKQLKGSNVTVNGVNPGITSTELLRHTSFFKSMFSGAFIRSFISPLLKSPTQAARAVSYVALDPSLEGVSGKCFKYKKEENIAENGKDEKIAQWLWLVSEKWTQLDSKNQLQT